MCIKEILGDELLGIVQRLFLAKKTIFRLVKDGQVVNLRLEDVNGIAETLKSFADNSATISLEEVTEEWFETVFGHDKK